MASLAKPLSYLSIVSLMMWGGSATELRAQASPSRNPGVVELYTSQGCSSCPPADHVLGELSAMPNVIALAFHVDYWDSIGWRDRYSLPSAVERQYRYVQLLGLSSAFTPQAIVDGRSSLVGSDKRRILEALAEPTEDRVPVNVKISEGMLSVEVPERRQGAKHYQVFAAAYLPQASTPVGRGENSGKTLQEYNIVRQFRSIGTWDGHAAVFHASIDSFPADASRVAVFLQHEGQGPIVGSAAIALR